jgi:hypothetical protein
MDYVCVVIHSGWGGNFAMESVATLPWNQWQLSRGIGGSFRVESVATFAWNRWQLSRGIGGNFAVEYACHWAKCVFHGKVGSWPYVVNVESIG